MNDDDSELNKQKLLEKYKDIVGLHNQWINKQILQFKVK